MIGKRITFASLGALFILSCFNISYAQDQSLPNKDMPPYKGVRYEDNVPDTLDLAQRADLIINALTHCVKDSDKNIMYLRYNLNDGKNIVKWQESSLEGEIMEALALMRMITGSALNINVDQAWREFFLEKFKSNELTFTGPAGGRQLNWIADNYIVEKDVGWKTIGEKAVISLNNRAVHEKNFAYFPDMPNVYGATKKMKGMPTGWEATFAGWILQGVAQFYGVSGSEKAKKLAEEMAYYLKDHAQIFDSSGRFVALHYFTGRPALHFVHHANTLVGILDYAQAAHNIYLGEFVKKSYEWARTTGFPSIGYFYEYLQLWPDNRPFENSETCATSDMIQIAIGLTRMGLGDYWDDVDRYLRNQFAENQLPVCNLSGEEHWWKEVGGAFASWPLPNEFNAPANIWTSFTTCCTAQAARAIYNVWSNMMEYKESSLKLNLLLNRASQWADVKSYIPYEGKVEIAIKKPVGELIIRAPEWIEANSKDIICKVNDAVREYKWQGRYINIGPVSPKDKVVFTFPIYERIVKEKIGKIFGKPVQYTFTLRGNNVVKVDPPGTTEPRFYEKGVLYRSGKTIWKDVERFVAELE